MRRLVCLVSLLSVAFMASSVVAADVTWDGEGTTDLWTEGANWDTDSVPTSSDLAILNETFTTVVDGTVNEAVQGLMVGYFDWDRNATLNVTGGSLTVGTGLSNFWGAAIGYGGNTTGIVNVSNGTLYAQGNLFVGGWGVGTLNVSGSGTVMADGAFVVGEASTGSAVNLTGGTLRVGGINVKAGNVLNISQGATLLIWDDVQDWVGGLEAAGLIVADGTLEMDYAVTNPGFTTVTVVPEPATLALLSLGGLLLRRKK